MYFFRYLRLAGLLSLLLPFTLYAAIDPAIEEDQEQYLYNPLVAFIGCSRYEEPDGDESSMPHLDQVPPLLESLKEKLHNGYSYICRNLKDKHGGAPITTQALTLFLASLKGEIDVAPTCYDGLIVVAMGYGEEKEARGKKGGTYFTMVLSDEDARQEVASNNCIASL